MDENEYKLELHKVNVQWQQENLRGAIALAGQTIKSLELVNGGAAIGLLTFYGNVLARVPKGISFDKAALTHSLICFGGGVALAVFCSIFAYLSQLESATKARLRVEIPVRIVAFIFGILSACAFLVGTWYGGASFG